LSSENTRLPRGGDPTCLIRGKEDDGGGNIFGPSDSDPVGLSSGFP